MQHTRPRSQVFSIAAAVLALHAALCWLLLSGARGVRIARGSQSLEIVLLAPAALTPSRRPLPERAGRPPSKSTAASPSPPAAPEPEPDGAVHPRVDWDAELARAAEAAAAGAARPKPKDFGFPAAEAPPAKRPQFGWDYAATHRIQPIDGGGFLVNLNDNCAMVFLPLPFVFCKPGRKPANGELFRHMSPLAGEVNTAE
jgi:hypothetical protein